MDCRQEQNKNKNEEVIQAKEEKKQAGPQRDNLLKRFSEKWSFEELIEAIEDTEFDLLPETKDAGLVKAVWRSQVQDRLGITGLETGRSNIQYRINTNQQMESIG